jgi:succinyl-diaminopimelate desuccinylase
MMKQEILDLTLKLVEIKSLPKGAEDECIRAIEVVKEYMGDTVHYQEYSHKGVHSILFGHPDTLLTPKMLLSGHLDVVDADPETFVPQIVGDILHVRGGGDMKGPDAAMLVAFKKYKTEHPDDTSVGLLFTTDEEIGGFNGARYMVESEGLRPEIVFVPDGGGDDYQIIFSQKAPHHFKVHVPGRGGHASRAFELDNPHNRLDALTAALRGEYAKATPENDWQSTMERTVITPQANSENAIPGEVNAWFCWRFPSEKYDFQTDYERIKAICEQFNCQIVDEHGQGEGTLISPEDPVLQQWKGIVERLIGREIKVTYSHGSSDGRHFDKYGSTVLLNSAIAGEFHNAREWVNVESLVIMARGLLELFDSM